MIQSQAKPYQLVLWVTEDRGGSEPALRLEFDRLEDALAAFESQRGAGAYRSGVLMRWHKVGGSWDLLDRYPQ
jgi:hypothetical protein